MARSQGDTKIIGYSLLIFSIVVTSHKEETYTLEYYVKKSSNNL